jgi:catechol 2,3-dioxygenase-like lactoylglutathione lyase family enzyme
MPAGDAALELLRRPPPVADRRFVDKRGPGLHHITLRVENLEAALEQLKARGVRLIDETPRPGSHQSRIAFVHPASTHGVLVELKESAREPRADGEPPTRQPLAKRIALGDLELMSLSDGSFRLDGGAMFGTVPR